MFLYPFTVFIIRSNISSSVTSISPSIHRYFLSVYRYPLSPFIVFSSPFSVIQSPFVVFPTLFTLFSSPFKVFLPLSALVLPPFIDISLPVHLFVTLVISFQSASLLRSCWSNLLHNMCSFFFVRILTSLVYYFPYKKIPIPSVPLYQILIFTLSIISFLWSVFTRSRFFLLQSNYPIRARVLSDYESYPFIILITLRTFCIVFSLREYFPLLTSFLSWYF